MLPSSALLELDQDLFGHGLQRIEDSHAGGGDRLEGRLALVVEDPVHLVDRHHGGKVSLVELQGVRNGREVEPMLLEVGLQVADRLDVGFHPRLLAVGDEDHAVDPLEDQLAARVVEDLAGDGVEMEAGGEAADAPQVEGEEVEEQRAVGLGGQRNHLALRLGRCLVVDVLQIGRLPTQAGAVVDDLAVDLLAGVVDESHLYLAPSPDRREAWLHYSPKRASISSSVISEKGLAGPPGPAPLSLFWAMVSKIFSRSTLARLTRRRTRPSEDRSSKMTTRMARLATMEMWMWSCWPSWKSTENSRSPMSLARPSVAATFPAVREASEVTSNCSISPAEAICCPFLSIKKTALALASCRRRRRASSR